MACEDREPVEVLYIAGAGRSGSTLLSNMLQAVPGTFSAGELRFLWERGLLLPGRCGCGHLVRECPVWSAVLDAASPAEHEIDPRGMIDALASRIRMQQVPAVLGNRRHGLDEIAPCIEQLGSLYRAIAEVTGSTVVIDASKLPSYALLLDQVPGVRLKILHLVRDARATAYSWQRRRRTHALVDDADEQMDRFSPAKSAAVWTVWNVLAAVAWRAEPERYLRVRYDTLVAEPEATLSRVADFMGRSCPSWPIVDGTFTLAENHNVYGNPIRFVSGPLVLEPDEAWRRAMRWRDRVVVEMVSAPGRWVH